MNPEMEENLQDLKDIRNHMYRYYDVGQGIYQATGNPGTI